MTEKTINTRIGLKIDTLANWNSSTLILKKGEVAFATTAASTGTGLSEPVTICKIGDGTKTFSQLPDAFYAKASDVLAACKSETDLATFINSHLKAGEGITLSFANNTVTITHSTPTGASAGAKGSTTARTYLKTVTTDKFGHITGVTTGTETVVDTNQTITVSEENTTFEDNGVIDFRSGDNITILTGADGATDTITIIGKDWSDEINEAKTAVTNLENGQVKTNKTNIEELQNQIGGLTGAMHFIGVSTSDPQTGAGATVSGHDTWAAGDVVLYGNKEYVLTKPGNTDINWAELGDESSYVLKTTTVNGKALSSNITLTASDVGADPTGTAQTLINGLDVASAGGSGKYISTISQTDGKISATAATLPTALKNPNALTFGSKTYDGSAAATIVATDLGALTEITTTANGGLKVTNKSKIDIDDDVTFVLDCGGAN